MQLPRAATLLMRPVPIFVVQRAARLAFARVMARHPNLFERLGEHGGKIFAFAPTDLPFAFAVTPQSREIRVVRSGAVIHADVTVTGPIVLLLALLEGRVDGDAQFFARELDIAGDMEAILALRNALDDNEIDLPSEIAPIAGPLAGVVQKGLERMRTRLLAQRPSKWN